MGRDRGDRCLLCLGLDGPRHRMKRSRRRPRAAIQAAFQIDCTSAGDDIPDAVRQHGVRKNRRGAGASPTTSPVFSAACLSTWAPRFSSGSFRSNSFAMVTPSLQTIGVPQLF